MADAQLKRLRSDDPETSGSEDPSSISKRQKPHGTFLPLLHLHEDDEAQSHDLTDIFSTLQQEISAADAFDLYSPAFAAEDYGTAVDDDGAESVMRRLLEASDDELGIPTAETLYDNNDNRSSDGDDKIGGIGRSGEDSPFGFVDNLWEFDDVAANYYAMLQSELFM